jgi:spoIIIJ-associated protein
VSQGESAVTEPQVSADQAEPAQPLDEPDERDEPVAAAEADADADEADADADEDSDGGDDDPGQEDDGTAAPGLTDVADLELEGEVAADYIEGLLDVADLDGDIDMDVEGDRAVVSVVGATLDEMVG